jgi:hypothetical protein
MICPLGSIQTDKEHSKVKTERRLFVNRRKVFLLTLLLASLAVTVSASRGGNSANFVTPQKRSAAVVVFAIAGEPDEYHMDAVVIVDGKRLLAPFSDEQKDRQQTFAEKYFVAGRTYRLMFGGGEAGSVTVKKWSEGCNNIHAEVTPATSVKLGGKVMALATNSSTIGKHEPARRAPTDGERAAVMTLMKSIYSQHRTPAGLVGSIKVTNLTATDLDGDGKYEIIGSFTLGAKNKFERDLFLIAHQQGAVMRADFVKFQAYQPPPEGFLSSIDLIDQVDLDGDGIGEVFANQGGFDGYALLVFKRVRGVWRQVYDTMGDAC